MQGLKSTISRRILLIEDNHDDAELISHQLDVLSLQGISSVEHRDSLAGGLSRLQQGGIDLVLLDLSLPDSQGIDTFLRLSRSAPSVPVIVLTGSDDDDIAIRALRLGAQDYLVKGRIDSASICRSINYAMERHLASDEHEKLAAIVESSNDAIIGKTLNGTITSWNKGAEQIFGYSAEEATGKSVDMLIPADSPGELETMLTALTNGESIRNRETVRVKKGGERIDVLASSFPIRREDGTVSSAAAIDRDITAQKHAQRTLQQTEQRLSLALKAAEVGVWDLDLANGTVWRSLRHDEIYGHDSLQPNWSFEIFLTYVLDEDREYARQVFRKAVETGQFKMECRIVRTDKALRWISALGETFRDEHGTLLRMMGTVVDVTDRKEQEAQQRLLAIMKEREDFMTTLTHDMKNPLVGANRLLELLAGGRIGQLTDEQSQVLQTVMHGNTNVLNMIRNLADIYRLDLDVGTLMKVDTDLVKLIAASVSRMTPTAKLSGLEIVTELPDQFPHVRVDSQRVERVIQNLLDNAIKFTPAHGRITVRLFKRDEFVVIEVEDNGPGIKPQEQRLLFQRFSQGSEGKRYSGGTGLGLYFCKQVTEAHGGTIECLSEADISTTFRIELPLKYDPPALAQA